MNGQSWDKTFDITKIDLDNIRDFVTIGLPHILPPEINKVLQAGGLAKQVV